MKTKKIPEQKLPGLTQYTAEQMFFISFGQVWCNKATDRYTRAKTKIDVHSPGELR